MYPEILTHPHIGSYSAMLLAGYVAGFMMARWRAKHDGFETRHIDNIVLLLLVICPIGARFFSRLFDFPTPIGFWEALKIWKGGGLVFYGGMIFGASMLVVYAAVAKLPFLKLADVLAPSLALGLVFGRVGCFLAGCCWGDICVPQDQLASLKAATMHQAQTFPALSPEGFFLAVEFPPGSGAFEQHKTLKLIASEATRSLPVHPSQLYEAALVLGLCLLLNGAFAKKRAHGEITAAFAVGYGFIRFGVEFFRADTQPIYFGMSISQVISICIAVAGLMLFFIVRKTARRDSVAPLRKEVLQHLI